MAFPEPLLAKEDKCLYTLAVRFEWDPQKAAANLRAHRISFADAVTVLEDAFALTREERQRELYEKGRS